MARPKKEPRQQKKKRLFLRISEIEKELDVIVKTGIPHKYMRLKKEKERKVSKLRSMNEWDDFKKYWTG